MATAKSSGIASLDTPKLRPLVIGIVLTIGAVVISFPFLEGWITGVPDYANYVASGIVVVMLVGAANYIRDAFRHESKTVFKFDVRNEESRLGVAISTVRGTVKNAQPKVNGIRYRWEVGPNSEVEKKDIIAGADSSVIFPYRVSYQFLTFDEYITFPPNTDLIVADYKSGSIPPTQEGTDLQIRRGFLLEVREVTKNEIVYRFGHMMPDLKGFAIFDPAQGAKNGFNIMLRIVGEGLDEAKEVKGRISVQNIQALNLDKAEPAISYGFQFTERK
jgi:hypothetical protein